MPIFGSKVQSGRGYQTFLPRSLQEIEEELDITSLYSLITNATLALGELNALNLLLPNPELLIEKYALKEALLSSQIEGTQSTLVEMFQNENTLDVKVDILEVKNYLKALNYGIDQIKNTGLPLSSRLLRQCHAILMNNVRGGESEKTPGEYRRSQNYIGGKNPSTAIYVPPKEDKIEELMSDLEKYIHHGKLPDVIKLALIHYQFETIHPFLDGNGRIGRLLISLFLIDKNIIEQPTLYLSLYLKKYKSEYYELLTSIRERNQITKWFEFFLKGIITICKQIITITKKIIALKENLSKTINNENEHKLLDLLFQNPTLEINSVVKNLNVSKATANKLVNNFVNKGLLFQINESKRYKRFLFKPYMDIIEADL